MFQRNKPLLIMRNSNSNNYFFLLISFGLVFSYCKHGENDPEPPEKIYFSGYTSLDETGASTGFADPSDWLLTDSWTALESGLFPSQSKPLCGSTSGLEVYPIAPNPGIDQFYLGFQSDSSAVWTFKLVDEDFNVVIALDSFAASQGYNAWIFNISDLAADTFRLYYQVERPNCIGRGHGDIIKQ